MSTVRLTIQVTLFTPTGPYDNNDLCRIGTNSDGRKFFLSPWLKSIAVSPQETTRDVEILSFDPATGALGFQQRVLSSGIITTTNQAIYDTEWSDNGQFLYLSIHGEPGIQADVLQYDLTNPLTSLASVLPQPNTIFRSFGLQMAPDSAIYHLYQATSGGPFLARKINQYRHRCKPGHLRTSGIPRKSKFRGNAISFLCSKRYPQYCRIVYSRRFLRKCANGIFSYCYSWRRQFTLGFRRWFRLQRLEPGIYVYCWWIV